MIIIRLIAIVIFCLILPMSVHAFTLSVTATGGSGSWDDGKYEIAAGAEVTFTCTPSSGTAPYSYCWDFSTRPQDSTELGDWDTDLNALCYSTDQNPSHTFNDYGVYHVWIYVTDSAGTPVTEKALLIVDVQMSGTVVDPTSDCGANNLVGNGATDNGTKLGDYLSAQSGNIIVQFPAGTYRFASMQTISGGSLGDVELRPVSGAAVTLQFDPTTDNDPSTQLYLLNCNTQMYVHGLTLDVDLDSLDLEQHNPTNGFQLANVAGAGSVIQNCTFTDFSSAVKGGNNATYIKNNITNWGMGGFLVTSWTDDGDGTYSKSLNTFTTLRAFEEDGNRLTKASSAAVSAGEWYPDQTNHILHYAPTDGTLDTEVTYAIYARSAIHACDGYNLFRNIYSDPNSTGCSHWTYSSDNADDFYFIGNWIYQDNPIGGNAFNYFSECNKYFYYNRLYDCGWSLGSVENGWKHYIIDNWIKEDNWGITVVSGSTGTFKFNYNKIEDSRVGYNTFELRYLISGHNEFTHNIFGDDVPASGKNLWGFERKYYDSDWCGDCTSDVSNQAYTTNDANPGCGSSCGTFSDNTNDSTTYNVEFTDPSTWEFTGPSVTASYDGTTLDLTGTTDAGSGVTTTARFPFQEGAIVTVSTNGINWSEIRDYSTSISWSADEVHYQVFDADHNPTYGHEISTGVASGTMGAGYVAGGPTVTHNASGPSMGP